MEKPANISWEQAAGIGVPFVTAMEGFRRAGTPKPGETLLIMGVNGKVGQAAAQIATWHGARVIGIVGKDGGYTKTQADACVLVPTVNANNITPHSEAFQAVVWHLWVSHPDIKVNQTKWESVVAKK